LRLLREARAAATLDHPNICGVYEVAEADGRFFIVMQYVEGETLDIRMKHRRIDFSEATDAIHNNLTLDKEGSALGRLRHELLEILGRHEKQAISIQRDVTSTLESMKARREESLRSTTQGNQFQSLVLEFVKQQAQKGGDVATVVL
jgi:serine/threonine protein kinase